METKDGMPGIETKEPRDNIQPKKKWAKPCFEIISKEVVGSGSHGTNETSHSAGIYGVS